LIFCFFPLLKSRFDLGLVRLVQWCAHPSTLASCSPCSARDAPFDAGSEAKLNELAMRLQHIEATVDRVPDKAGAVRELLGLCRGLQAENDHLVLQVGAAREKVALSERRQADLQRELARTAGNLSDSRKDFTASRSLLISSDETPLRESIAAIEADIAQFQPFTEAPQSVEPRELPDLPKDPLSRRNRLIGIKFERLDELVVVLKKRIARLEETEGLADVVSNFGSVPDLLEENQKLKHEVQELRSREGRFDSGTTSHCRCSSSRMSGVLSICTDVCL
jgi:outer membrane murein-binding lipoprotein Lpp